MSADDRDGQSRLKLLFQEALDLPAAEREAFLEQVAANEPELARDLRELLLAHERPSDLDHLSPATPPMVATPLPAANVEDKQLGKYRILEQIGSGGAGIVYRAHQEDLNRTVALKVLRFGGFASEEEIVRFRAEAEVVAGLDHPGIVPLYEVGQDGDLLFFSMKLIDGSSLAEQIRQERFGPRAAATLARKLADAVHHAHDRGILHRDLKPANILVDAEGNPYVADFGVAKRTAGEQDLTRSGWLAGTPTYMAPEQFRDANTKPTVQLDVYGLGCILFELLTGRQAVSGRTSSEIIRKVCNEEVSFLPDEYARIPRDLRTIVLHCLEKEPERRYPSAAALAMDLQRWLEGLPISARKTGVLERMLLQWKRRPVQTSLAAAVGILLAVVLIGGSIGSLVLKASLTRAETAEVESQEALRESLLATADLTRGTHAPGRRFESLELLKKAAAIRPGADLRDSAIAALALTDLQIEWLRELPSAIGPYALSPDGQLLAVAMAGNSLQVLDRRLGLAVVRRLELGQAEVRALEFDGDGRHLALKAHGVREADDPRFLVWDLVTDSPVVDLPLQVTQSALAFRPGHAEIAVGTNDGVLHLYRYGDEQPLEVVRIAGRSIDLAFSPDGERLAVIGAGSSVKLFAVPDLVEVGHLDCPGTPKSIAWSDDGQRIAVGGEDSQVYVWDLSDETAVRTLEGNSGVVVQVAFLPGSRFLVSSAWGGSMCMFDLDEKVPMLQTMGTIAGVSSTEQVFAIRSGRRLGIATIHDGDYRRVLGGTQEWSPSFLGAGPTSHLLLTTEEDALHIWDTETGVREPIEVPGGKVVLELHPTSNALYACSDRGLWTWPGHPRESSARRLKDGAATDLGFSPDGQRLAALCGNELYVARLDALGDGIEIPAPGGTIRPMLSADGRYLATGAWHGSAAHVWDARSGALLHRFEEAPFATVLIAISPDSQSLATGTADTVRLWRAGDWEQVWERPNGPRHSRLPAPVAFSPGGGLLAVSPDRLQVLLLDPASGEELATLTTTWPDRIASIRFSRDDRRLYTITTGEQVQVWDLAGIRDALETSGLGAWRP